MVLKSYIFSKESGIYKQYASDFTESLFKSFLNKNITSNQIAVHRDGNLMYYIFIYANPSHNVYGHCVVTGELCTDIQWLYNSFLMAFDSSAQKGTLFCYDPQGNVRKQVADFSSAGAEVDQFFRTFKEAVEINSKWKPLQPIDFTVSKDSSITLSLNEDKNAKIVEATEHYHNVIVTEFNNVPSSYAMTVKTLHEEKNQLSLKITSLEDKVSNLTKQKKQYGWVAILAFAVMALLIGLYAVKNNLSDEISRKNKEASDLRETISNQLATISQERDSIGLLRRDINSKDSQIYYLQRDLSTAKDSLSELEEQIASLNNELSNLQSALSDIKSIFPLVINRIEMGNVYYDGTIETNFGNSIYSSNTMYLKPKIYYTGLNAGSITLDVKLINPNGVLSTGKISAGGYSYSCSVNVSQGVSSVLLTSWGGEKKGHWSSGTYRLEVWCRGVCLKTHTFKIY